MKIVNTRRNIQVTPSKTVYFPNDRFAKKMFALTDDDFADMTTGKSRSLVELKQHKKFGKIVSPFRIYSDEEASFTLAEPVEQFDFDVLCVGISEYLDGNKCLTPGIIYRGLTGKVGDGDAPSKDQLAAILHSVEKLMFLKTQINISDYCQKLNCNGGKAFEVLAPLLPCERITETTVNGKETIVIQLLDQSPVWRVAYLKGQILSFEAALLNVPGQQNTKMNIELKNYVLRRIVEIKAHRQLKPTLTFKDIFEKCRLEDVSRKKKLDARETIVAFLEHLQKVKFIKSFELIKRGNSFYSIQFTYSK